MITERSRINTSLQPAASVESKVRSVSASAHVRLLQGLSKSKMAARPLLQALRATPIAGPSRIPIRQFSASRAVREPTTEICVRTSRPLPSVLHAYAILREVESKYGRVINFDVPRDPDSLQPTNIIFFSLLDPVELGTGSKRALHEIPAPVSEFGKNEIFGGPSLNDVQAVLTGKSGSGTASSPASSRHTSKSPKPQSVITFEVEKRMRHRARSEWDPTRKHITAAMIEEDEKIVAALERFGGGFFGGFEGVAEKHRAVLEANRKRIRRDGGRAGTAAEEVAEEVADVKARDDVDVGASTPEPVAARG